MICPGPSPGFTVKLLNNESFGETRKLHLDRAITAAALTVTVSLQVQPGPNSESLTCSP